MLLKTQGPLPVKTIVETLHLTPPAVSQHLKALSHMGLVQARRDGYVVLYEVDPHPLSDCCGMLVHVCARAQHRSARSSPEHPSEAEALRHRREALVRELDRIETELEALRGKAECLSARRIESLRKGKRNTMHEASGCCDGHGAFRVRHASGGCCSVARRYPSPAERREALKAYREQLKSELTGVEERLENLT